MICEPLTSAQLPEDSAGVHWRLLGLTDHRELLHLVTRIEIADATPYRTSESECRLALDDSEHHEIIGGFTADNDLVGYALLRWDPGRNQAYCSGGIHPAWRRHGLGEILISWHINRARAVLDGTKPWRIITHVDETHTELIDLLYRGGFIPREGYLEVTRPLGRLLPRGPRRPFTEIITWDYAYQTQVRALWNRLTGGLDENEYWVDHPEFFAPDCSTIALDKSGDRPKVIGFARTYVYPQDRAALGHTEGYVNEFLVEPQVGLDVVGKALVVAAMRACAARGLEALSGGVRAGKTETVELLRELKFNERGRMRRYELRSE